MAHGESTIKRIFLELGRGLKEGLLDDFRVSLYWALGGAMIAGAGLGGLGLYHFGLGGLGYGLLIGVVLGAIVAWFFYLFASSNTWF